MTFGEKIFQFYTTIKTPQISYEDIELLLPFQQDQTFRLNQIFYNKYYNDNHKRIFLIGINPGRFGAGITGIPFTDPVNLESILGIQNTFDKKQELSSGFIYSVINSMGGPDSFFQHFYFTAVSPIGFVQKGKNINYYDTRRLMTTDWEDFYIESLQYQIKAGADIYCAYSLGKGKNIKYLEYLNQKYKLFKEVKPLPHPRWVMQYRYKRRNEFVKLYTTTLHNHLK